MPTLQARASINGRLRWKKDFSKTIKREDEEEALKSAEKIENINFINFFFVIEIFSNRLRKFMLNIFSDKIKNSQFCPNQQKENSHTFQIAMKGSLV